MSHSVRNHLRVEIGAYDEAIRRFIPGYETMLAVAAQAVSEAAPDLVLDLGAGTGALSEALLREPRVGTVELLDVDEEMMDQARERLAEFGDRAVFSIRSYDEPFSPCDAVAASLSLHHVPTLAAKSAIYERAFAALRPGGVVVSADANMPDDAGARDRLYRHWADHMVACGIAEQRVWQHFEEWAGEDTYLPIEAELAELAHIGFDPECVWQDGPIGVIAAKKPAG